MKTRSFFTSVVLLLLLMIMIPSQACNVNAQEQLTKNEYISFYPSYLSPDDKTLAIDLWVKKKDLLRKDVGFIDLESGKLYPNTVNSAVPQYKDTYVEIEGFAWDPLRGAVYFTLQELGNGEKSRALGKTLFEFDVNSNKIKIVEIESASNFLIFPDVSRDGKQIIIIGCNELGQKGGEDGTLYIYNKESGKTRIFADKVDVFRPLFSPDGKEILFQRKKNLYVKSVAEERERRLTQFNGKLDISLVHWGEGSIYIITLKPTAEELAGAVDRWLKSKMKGKEPSYIKEVWRISFVRKEVRIKNIKSFRTMKQGIDIYGNTLLVSLPGGSGTSNIWKFDLEKGRLTQLTFGKDMDDLPMVIPGEGTIIFRRNLKNIYRMDKEGKTRPLKIFSYMP